MAEEGDTSTTQSDAGNDTDKDKGQVGMKELVEGLKTVTDAVVSLQANNKELAAQLEHIKNSTPAKPVVDEDDNADDKGDDDLPDRQLEGMSRKEFSSHLLKRMEKMLGKVAKDVETRTGEVSESAAKAAVQAEVKDLKGSNPDFDEWIPDMVKIAKEMPGISVTRALSLARAENPDKAKQMVEKYKKKDDDKGGNPGDAGKGGKPKFGGFTPTSGKSSPNQKMKPEEAAEKAYDEILGTSFTGEGT